MSEQIDAVENTAGASADDGTAVTPDHTPDADVVEKDAEQSPSSDDASESVEAPDAIDSEAEPAEGDELDFSDLTPNFIPADSDIDKLRIPKDERERLKKVAGVAREASTKLEGFGGDFALDALRPLASVLTRSDITDDESGEALAGIMEANPAVGTRLMLSLAENLFRYPKPDYANAILRRVYGDNATHDNIRTLLALDKEGLVDKDYGYEPSEMADIKRERDELREKLDAISAAPDDRKAEKALKELETDFYAEVPAKLQPVFERAHWPADSPLAKIVTELVQHRLKADPRYTDTEAFLKQVQTYRTGENRQAVVNANLHLLTNKAQAQVMEIVRDLQTAIKENSERSRNRILEQKQIQAKTVKETKPQPLPEKFVPLREAQERTRKAFLEAVKAGV